MAGYVRMAVDRYTDVMDQISGKLLLFMYEKGVNDQSQRNAIPRDVSPDESPRLVTSRNLRVDPE